MNNYELVQSLIEMVNTLPHRNEDKLEHLKIRARMIIRQVFGASSDYMEQMERIMFWSGWARATEQERDRFWVAGKSRMENLFLTMLEELQLLSTPQEFDRVEKTDILSSKRIFIVHGHDEEMKQAVARTLEKLELESVILHEQPDQGRTIIEKFTDYSDVGFAIVLFSPDDVGYTKAQLPEEGKPRARQNVIFELGFFVGKLGRDHVFILCREEKGFEMPSDHSGVLYTTYDKRGQWQFALVRELKTCGYEVDADRLI